MKKTIKNFLMILICILLVAYLILNNYTKQTENISSKVGSKIGGGELSMHEYYALSQYFDTYKNYINTKEYKKAYNMLGITYRNYIPYEEYEKNISRKNIEKLMLEEITPITASTYDLVIDNSGEKSHYSIINDTSIDRVYLYPESFLDYKNVEQKVKEKKIESKLIDYIVYVDKTDLTFDIKNNRSEKINAYEATLYTNLDDVITINESVEINSKESKKVVLSFDTDYAFPEKVVLKCIVGNKNVEFVYEINN